MGTAERRGDVTTERAIDWLEGPHRRPFFLWVHYYDPHTPYDPPAPFAGRYAQPYDGEIAFVDEQIGRLLTAVEGARDRETLVVVVADHGEGMGEHGEWFHAFLVQEATLRIPLIFYARSGLPAGLAVAARVSQVDLMPTILSLLGIGLPPDLDGVDLTGSPDPDRPVRAEAAQGRAYYGWARLAALYRGPLKYVEGPRPELYDFRSDPLERRNLVDSRAQDAAAMRRQLRALDGAAADALAAPAELLETGDIERLAALGYVVAGGRSFDAEEQGPDPKQMLPLMVPLQSLVSDFESYQAWPAWKRFLAAVTRSPAARSRPELIRELEKIAADHPDFAPVYQFLAVFYRQEHRPEDAARVLERQALLRGNASPPHEEQPDVR